MFSKVVKIILAIAVVFCVICKIIASNGDMRAIVLFPIGAFIAIGCVLILFFRWAYGKLFKTSKKLMTEAINDSNSMRTGMVAKGMKMFQETVKTESASVRGMNSKTCQNCGFVLDEDDVFCPSCGAKTIQLKTKTCEQCGQVLNEDEDFCPYCGTKYVDPDSRICKVCGNKIRPGADFCGKCGTRFEA